MKTPPEANNNSIKKASK